MGFRFHKSLSIIPGVRVNLSKTGLSLSVGEHGMTENFNLHGGKTTVGLPGSGLSYSTSRRTRGGMPLVLSIIAAIAAYAFAHLSK